MRLSRGPCHYQMAFLFRYFLPQQFLFPEQVGMRSSIHKGKRQDPVVLSVAQKTVWTDMEFSRPCENAGQFVVTKLFVKSLVRPE